MTDALQHLYDRLRAERYPTAQMGGIYANKPGYHNKRDNLPSSDYSCQQPDDQAGSGQNASGLDITLNPTDMRDLTQRLIDLTLARDPRIQVAREFFGTVDGVNVTGMDVRDVRWITSDPSHIWHDHISIFRRWAGDLAAMDALADAILGGTTQPDTGGFLMALSDQQQADLYNNVATIRGQQENTIIPVLSDVYNHTVTIRGHIENSVIPIINQTIDLLRDVSTRVDQVLNAVTETRTGVRQLRDRLLQHIPDVLQRDDGDAGETPPHALRDE